MVNRIIHLSVRRGLARRIPDEYTALNIDEKSFLKGHTYVTVLSDPVSGVVIDYFFNDTWGVSGSFNPIFLSTDITGTTFTEVPDVGLVEVPANVDATLNPAVIFLGIGYNLSSIILTRTNLMKQHQRHMILFPGNHFPHLFTKEPPRHRNPPLIALVFLDLAG